MIEVILAIFSISYLILIFVFSKANNKYSPQKAENSLQKISVVIPFRNEEKNIPNLIHALKNQNLKKQEFEIIWVDDNSTDNSIEVIEKRRGNLKIKLLKLKEKEGKKEALKKGILASENNLIITTDADTMPNEKWLKTMQEYFEKGNPDLLLGPVEIKGNKTLFSSLQQIEFAALLASTQGCVALNKAIIANGANLAFKKETYLQFNRQDLAFTEASGDDVFFLHAIKRKYKEKAKISFANTKEALVETIPKSSIKSLIHQRIRWAKKTRYYKDSFSIIVSFIVFTGNIALPIMLILCSLRHIEWMYLSMYFLAKVWVDVQLLYSISNWRSFTLNYLHIFILSLVYPVYLILLALLSLRIQPQWKERKV